MNSQKKIAIVTLKGNDAVSSLAQGLRSRGYVCDFIFSGEHKEASQYDNFLKILLGYDLIYFRVLANKNFREKLLKDLDSHNKIIINRQYLEIPEITSKVFQMDKARTAGVQVPNFKQLPFKDISIDSIKEFTNVPAIVKASVGIAGRSVFLVSDQSDIDKIVFDHTKDCIIQDFIPYEKDLRVFTIDGKIWKVMERRPGNGDFKANISQGGTGHSIEDLALLSQLESAIQNLHPIFEIEIAGYDFLETKDKQIFFLEINSNPGWRGLDAALQVETAIPIADYIESLF